MAVARTELWAPAWRLKKFNLNLILTRNIKYKEINQYLKVFKRKLYVESWLLQGL